MQSEVPFDDALKGVDYFLKITTSLAVVIGGYLAWYRFIKSREFLPKFDANVSLLINKYLNNYYIIVYFEIENTSLSSVKLISASIELFEFEPMESLESAYTVDKKSIGASEVLKDVTIYLSKEHQREKIMFCTPSASQVGFGFNLRIVYRESKDKTNKTFTATGIEFIGSNQTKKEEEQSRE